jgi:hypothetical protein
MTLKEKILYHQIHLFKLETDIGCEPVSLYFLWRHNLVLGLTTHFIPPIVSSLLVIRFADSEPNKYSRAGACLPRHRTRTVEAVRWAGDIVMALGAWFHRPYLIALGLAVVILAWCAGQVREPAANWGAAARLPARGIFVRVGRQCHPSSKKSAKHFFRSSRASASLF